MMTQVTYDVYQSILEDDKFERVARFKTLPEANDHVVDQRSKGIQFRGKPGSYRVYKVTTSLERMN